MQAQVAWTLHDFALMWCLRLKLWYTHPVPDFTSCNATHAYFYSFRGALVISACIIRILRPLCI